MAKEESLWDDLHSFAMEKLSTPIGRPYRFTFRPGKCVECGGEKLTLTIEHHTGSKVNDFKGVIHYHCASCGHEGEFLRFTSDHRSFLRRDEMICRCGSKEFYVGECERFEVGNGLDGFFDEGVVVEKCIECGKNRVLVYTD